MSLIYEYIKHELDSEWLPCESCQQVAPLYLFDFPPEEPKYQCEICAATDSHMLQGDDQVLFQYICGIANVMLDKITK